MEDREKIEYERQITALDEELTDLRKQYNDLLDDYSSAQNEIRRLHHVIQEIKKEEC